MLEPSRQTQNVSDYLKIIADNIRQIGLDEYLTALKEFLRLPTNEYLIGEILRGTNAFRNLIKQAKKALYDLRELQSNVANHSKRETEFVSLILENIKDLQISLRHLGQGLNWTINETFAHVKLLEEIGLVASSDQIHTCKDAIILLSGFETQANLLSSRFSHFEYASTPIFSKLSELKERASPTATVLTKYIDHLTASTQQSTTIASACDPSEDVRRESPMIDLP